MFTELPLLVNDERISPELIDDVVDSIGPDNEFMIRAHGTYHKIVGYMCLARLRGIKCTVYDAAYRTDCLDQMYEASEDPLYLSAKDVAELAMLVRVADSEIHKAA